MIRIDKTREFIIDCSDKIYLKDMCLPLSREIFAYIDNILQEDLGLFRFDSHENHEDVNWETTSYDSNYGLVGQSMIGWYRLTEQDTNILILEVVTGFNATNAGAKNLNTFSFNTNDSYYYNINLYYSTTYSPDGQYRTIRNFNNTDYINNELNFYFLSENAVLSSAGIRSVGSIERLSNKVFKTKVNLQIVKNAYSKFITLNNYENGLPRIGIVQTGINKVPRKAFIYSSSVYNFRDDIYRHSIKNLLALDSNKYIGFYTPNILKSKFFNNLESKIPSMTMYPGYNTSDADPSIFNLSEPLEGFLQTTANFSGGKDSRYIINNNSYTNLGNCILMHD